MVVSESAVPSLAGGLLWTQCRGTDAQALPKVGNQTPSLWIPSICRRDCPWHGRKSFLSLPLRRNLGLCLHEALF